MTAPRIHHIGVLVSDLDEGIARYRDVLGIEFSAIGRYRTDRYRDESDVDPHWHDARFALSLGACPKIELLEATGDGTHSAKHLGAHHLALTGYADLEEDRARVIAAGARVEASNTDTQGRLLLFFSAAEPWSGTRLEFVSALPGPIVLDDGTPAPIDRISGRPSMLAVREGEL